MSVEINDPHDMISETSNVVNDLEAAIDAKLDLVPIEYRNILVCGMGGSAIGGDIVADCLYAHSDKPIRVIRSPELPAWADSESLVLVSSYSGNTAETLSVYDKAIARGCRIVAITSGGKLKNKAEADNVPCILVKSGLQPRNAVGNSIGYMINAIATIGGPDLRGEVRDTIPALKKYISSLSLLDSQPRKIAGEIIGSLPVIYSSNSLSAIASRWRAQFNENSKLIAFDGHIPDTNHGDLTGVVGCNGVKIKPIILVEENQTKLLRNSVNATIATLKNRGMKPYVIRIPGKTVFEREMRAMMLGDFISLHIAFFKDIDPSDVSSISKLKAAITKRLGKSRRSKR
ncbi:MAG: SIS domain-containing protein [Candidatus Methanomethylophilaceae archaeon]